MHTGDPFLALPCTPVAAFFFTTASHLPSQLFRRIRVAALRPTGRGGPQTYNTLPHTYLIYVLFFCVHTWKSLALPQCIHMTLSDDLSPWESSLRPCGRRRGAGRAGGPCGSLTSSPVISRRIPTGPPSSNLVAKISHFLSF